MASPIDTNASVVGQVSATESHDLNIPNDGQNYHWFLSENMSIRTPITITDNAINGINAAMGVDALADRILSHLQA